MRQMHNQVCNTSQAATRDFEAWKLEHVLRDSNEKPDVLAIVDATLIIKETVFLLVYFQPTSSLTTN